MTSKQMVEEIRAIIREHDIDCAESIYQCDRIQLAAADIVHAICEIVGYSGKSLIPLCHRKVYWRILKDCAAMFGMSKKDINARVKELKPEFFNDDLFYHNEPLYWAAGWAGIDNPDDYHAQYREIQEKYYE